MMLACKGPHVEEAQNHIWSKMETVEQFVNQFAGSKSAAAVGAGVFEQINMEEVEQEEEAVLQQGLSNATAKK